jgi:hypothetical protein
MDLLDKNVVIRISIQIDTDTHNCWVCSRDVINIHIAMMEYITACVQEAFFVVDIVD